MPRRKQQKNKEKKEEINQKVELEERKDEIEEVKNKEENEEKEDNEEEEEGDEEEEYEEVENVNDNNNYNINEADNEYDFNEENELSDDIFNLKEEEIKSNEKIKIAYDTTKADSEDTSLDQSLKLYNNNFNVMKPKYLGKIKTLLFFRNTPILVFAESSN